MKQAVALAACGILAAQVSWADIIEVRGKGMMTGTIVSQDDQGLSFKGNDGQVVRYAKQEVLFVDVESPRGGASPQTGSKTPPLSWQRVKAFFADAPTWLNAVKRQTDRLTRKFRDVAGKPVDRSAVEAQTDAVAKALDDAGKAQAEAARKERKVREELKRVERGLDASKRKDAFEGTFGKL